MELNVGWRISEKNIIEMVWECNRGKFSILALREVDRPEEHSD